MASDASSIKEKILLILNRNGPSLPVEVSSQAEISTLFASAFLSELISEKRVVLSRMKVGNSPLYLLPGQEEQIEKFAHHLKSKEKEAFELLKNRKFLKDLEQEPALRIALREIRDFAIPFKKNDEIIWRYFKIPEEEYSQNSKPKQQIVEHKKEEEKDSNLSENLHKEEIKNEKIKGIEEKSEKKLDIFDKRLEKKEKPKKTPVKRISKKSNTNEKFFNIVKEYLSSKSIDILTIEGFTKNELWLKINDSGKERLLYAFDKKRITEADIIKASKKASEVNLDYMLLSKGEPLKKTTNLIEALKTLYSLKTL